MTDSAASSDERKRHSAFKRGDVLIFVVFPMVLILGFLLFQWWRPMLADPNLRLVAQVTDDISVELVAVAQYTNQTTPYTKWWKPNGLPTEGIVEEAPGFFRLEGISDTRLFLFRVSEQRPSVEPSMLGLIAGNSVGTDPSRDGKTTIVIATVSPMMFSTSSCGVKVASLGRQKVGVLTPEKPSFDSTVHGQHASIDIGKSSEVVPEDMRRGRCVWAVRIQEHAPDQCHQSVWQVHILDRSGRALPVVSHGFKMAGTEFSEYLQFNGDDWATVSVDRTVYDKEVVFDGVAAHCGFPTSPRIDYIGPVRSK